MGQGPDSPEGGRQIWAAAGALLSGCLLLASYPPYGMAWAAWFALVPLLVVWRARPGFPLAAATIAAGVLWGGTLFYPLLFVEGADIATRVGGFLLVTGTVAAFLTLFCLGFSWVSARFAAFWPAILLAPALWITLEYALRNLAAGFSVYFGVTQWASPPVLAIAAAGGIHAVSGAVVGANGLLALAAEQAFAHLPGLRWLSPPPSRSPGRARPAGALLAVLGTAAIALWVLAPAGGGPDASAWRAKARETGAPQGEGAAGASWQPREAAAPKGIPDGDASQATRAGLEGRPDEERFAGMLTVVLVQPGITPAEYLEASVSFSGHQGLLGRALALTDDALRSLERSPGSELRLVVWPETTLHVPAFSFDALRKPVEELTVEHGVYLLAGLPRSPFEPPPFGSGDDPSAGDPRARNAAYLVTPAGESRAVYDKVYVIPVAESHYAPGTSVRPFEVEAGGSRLLLGVGICSDVIEPRHALAAVRGGAASLHYLASLGGVGNLAALERAFLSFRAAEHGVYVTQAATTGPTLVVDPKGRTAGSLSGGGAGVLVVSVPLAPGGTWYTRLGDWPAALSGAVLGGAGVWLSVLGGVGRNGGTPRRPRGTPERPV